MHAPLKLKHHPLLGHTDLRTLVEGVSPTECSPTPPLHMNAWVNTKIYEQFSILQVPVALVTKHNTSKIII